MAAIDDLLRQLGLAGKGPNALLPGGPNPIGGTLMPPQFGGTLPVMPNPVGGNLMPIPPQPQPSNPDPLVTGPYPQPPGPTPTPTNPVIMPGTPPPLPPKNSTGENPFLPKDTGGNRDLYDTGWSKKLGQLNPLSEWTRWTGLSNMGGNDRKGQFAANQFNKFNNAFNANLLERPDDTIREFAKRTDPMAALNREWLGASAGQRGLNPAARAQTIRWG